VGLQNPHIEEVSYQHPAGYDRSAVCLVVYLSADRTTGRTPAWVPGGAPSQESGASGTQGLSSGPHKFGAGELKGLKEWTDGLAMSLGLQQELERELALRSVVEMSREELSYGLEL
jgi:hypothetical protein